MLTLLTLLTTTMSIMTMLWVSERNNCVVLVSGFSGSSSRTTTTKTTKTLIVPQSRRPVRVVVPRNTNEKNHRRSSTFQLWEATKDNNNYDQTMIQQRERDYDHDVDDDDPQTTTTTGIPHIETFRSDIRKWSSRHAPHEASKVLRDMFRYYNPNNTQTKTTTEIENENDTTCAATTNTITITNRRRRSPLRAPRRRPVVDAIDCNQVINAWSRSNQEEAPKHCMAILKSMYTMYEQNKNNNHDSPSNSIRPDVVTYTSVINAFARHNNISNKNRRRRGNGYKSNSKSKSNVGGDYESAMKVFKMQMNDYKNNNNRSAKPNLRTFNTMINVVSKSTPTTTATATPHTAAAVLDDRPEIAERLLAAINDWYRREELEEGPNTITYNSVINCWNKASSRRRPRLDAPQRVLELLLTMIANYQESKSTAAPTARPDLITYHSILNTMSQQGDVKGAETVLRIMKEDYQSGNQHAKPTVTTYTILINTLSKSNNSNSNNGKDTDIGDAAAPMQAELLLLEMIELYEQGILIDSPNTIVYSSVINCWSKSNRPEAPQRCFDILQTMLSKYKEDHDNDNGNDNATTTVRNHSVIRPDRITYNSVMNAYAKRGDVNGAKKVWKMMIKDAHITADVQTYNTLIDAWSKSGHEKAPEEAGLLLMEMIEVSNNQNKKKGGTHHNNNTCPVLGCRPDTITYTGVINCWSKSQRPEAPSRALAILHIMISKAKENGEDSTVQPNTITYNSVMDAHAKQGDVEGALQVFNLMKKKNGSSSSSTTCTPDVTTYTILIDAYAKKANKNCHTNKKKNHEDDSMNAPLEAEALLMEMIELYEHGMLQDGPNTITYATVINCWSKSKRPEAPQRAMDILQTMRDTYKKQQQQQQPQQQNQNDTINNNHEEQQQHKKGRRKNVVNSSIRSSSNVVIPNTIVYSTVMDAYAKQGDVEGAKQVFTMMKEDYFNAGNTHAKPNRFAYTTIIDAYSKSNHQKFPQAPLEAEATLMEMIELYSKGEIEEGPNTIVYSAVINCWSKSNRPEGPRRCLDILQIMISKYEVDGNEEVKPDIITYNSILDAHVRQGDVGGAMNVLRMMSNKEEDSTVFDTPNGTPNPNVLTYNILIDGWSKSGEKEAPIEVENLLREMLTKDYHHHHQHHNNNENDGGAINNETGRGTQSLSLTPDATTYALLIKCLEKYPGTEDRVQELKEIVKTKDASVQLMLLEEEQASK